MIRAALFGPPAWRVVPARMGDAPAIAALHAASFARGWEAAEIEAMLIEPSTVCDLLHAGARRTPAGFALSRCVVDEAEVLSIAVAARRRGQGGGRALLGRHLSRLAAAGARRVVLEVDEVNAPALRLYARFGFAGIGSRPAYYARPDGSRGNAVLMARALG